MDFSFHKSLEFKHFGLSTSTLQSPNCFLMNPLYFYLTLSMLLPWPLKDVLDQNIWLHLKYISAVIYLSMPFSSLCLSFLIYKMGIIIHILQNCWSKYGRWWVYLAQITNGFFLSPGLASEKREIDLTRKKYYETMFKKKLVNAMANLLTLL